MLFNDILLHLLLYTMLSILLTTEKRASPLDKWSMFYSNQDFNTHSVLVLIEQMYIVVILIRNKCKKQSRGKQKLYLLQLSLKITTGWPKNSKPLPNY